MRAIATAGSLLLAALAAVSTLALTAEPRSDAATAIEKVEKARDLLRKDLYEDALDAAGSAVELSPELAAAHETLAAALYRRGDFPESEHHYRRAVELDPDDAAAHFGVGRILRTLGSYAEAAESFHEAARLAPETPKYLRTLSNHLARREDSLELLRRYLAIARRDGANTGTSFPPEGEETIRNVEAWVALLETLGDRPLAERVKSEPCTVRLQIAQKQPYLRLKVGGLEKQRFVFDTGATGITISPRLAKKAGLTPIKPFSIGGTGAGRTETGSLVLIDEIAIEDRIVIRNLPATVRDPAGPEEGLIGPSTFSQFNITVDLDGRRLAFEPTGTGTTGRTEPFRNVGGQILVTARVNDLPFNAMLDSGSTSTIVGTTTLARVPGLDTVPGRWLTGTIVGVGGPITVRRMILQGSLSMAGRAYPADGLPTGDLSGLSRALESEVYLILGFPHLDDSAFTIDYERMTVTFSSS